MNRKEKALILIIKQLQKEIIILNFVQLFFLKQSKSIVNQTGQVKQSMVLAHLIKQKQLLFQKIQFQRSLLGILGIQRLIKQYRKRRLIRRILLAILTFLIVVLTPVNIQPIWALEKCSGILYIK